MSRTIEVACMPNSRLVLSYTVQRSRSLLTYWGIV